MHSNLYLFFIYKSILHLNNRGELIFITPRDFLKSTSSVKLNEFIFNQGSITNFIDLGDKKIFNNAQPNCAIWRFEKGNFTRLTSCLREFTYLNGQISFIKKRILCHLMSYFLLRLVQLAGLIKFLLMKNLAIWTLWAKLLAKQAKLKK